MNQIRNFPFSRLGLDFIPPEHLRDGRSEYDLRDFQNPFAGTPWRTLDTEEIKILAENGNRCDDWTKILVAPGFQVRCVENCRFHGLVRIGALEEGCLEYHDLRLPVGLYNSTVVSCDIGFPVSICNVRYMAHSIVENGCILFNVDELLTTNHAKFGNGIVKESEEEDVRVWLEIANENGGRRVLPFDGLLPGDAWLWSKYRNDTVLMNRFKDMVDQDHQADRGYYGRVGEQTVIKDCRVIKDVRIGSHAYLKGCNKLKNLTINSSPEASTQIGEGVELVNGIIGYGCHIFYGVKAVRFVLCDHSNLKYGARLINAVLGSNSTISCCEVLNSLIFPGHEQHHNNSFLCASTFLGQTNMASAATIGSNHNSRGSDGEILAGRGFWPALSVSLKHSSRFASFTLITKGSYPAEIVNPLPFSLIANDEHRNELQIIPAYWFHHNMYALFRNATKYEDRDKRIRPVQRLEFDWLAPDTVNEILYAKKLLKQWAESVSNTPDGTAFLEDEEDADLTVTGLEAGKRRVRIRRAGRAWRTYGELLIYYGVKTLLHRVRDEGMDLEELTATLGRCEVETWENVGGQLIPKRKVEVLKEDIRDGKIKDWAGVHENYERLGREYPQDKLRHAWAVLNTDGKSPSFSDWRRWLDSAAATQKTIAKGVRDSRQKDYENPFWNITYDNDAERNAVVGPLKENPFIRRVTEETEAFLSLIEKLLV